MYVDQTKTYMKFLSSNKDLYEISFIYCWRISNYSCDFYYF